MSQTPTEPDDEPDDVHETEPDDGPGDPAPEADLSGDPL